MDICKEELQKGTRNFEKIGWTISYSNATYIKQLIFVDESASNEHILVHARIEIIFKSSTAL